MQDVTAEANSLEEGMMGELSIYHWLLVLALIILLFGSRKIPELMRGVGGGIRSFREGMKGDREKSPGKDRST
jgi:sec-independent protein translocase protein TatA